MHRATPKFATWYIIAAMFLLAGCTPPEPQATPESQPAEPLESPDDQAAAPRGAEPQADVETPAADVATESTPQPPQAAAPDEPVLAQVEVKPQTAPPTDAPEPEPRTVFYRADSAPAEIPPVVLSKTHEALCKVRVGDAIPDIQLPQIGNGGQQRKLSDLFGERATVVVFWNSGRRMAREQLADLGPDVVQPFGKQGVAAVGIAVNESAESAQSALQQAGAEFANLLDAEGKAFAQVGSEKLPRTYLLDAQGKILWFDIEYSHATRRELNQALRAVMRRMENK